MSLEMCYAAMGGDLEGVRARLITDERILKFLHVFTEDGTMDLLRSAFESANAQEAFRAAHTLKGVARDLGLSPLCEAAVELTEALRPDEEGRAGDIAAAADLYERTKSAHRQVIDAIAIADL